MLILGVVHKSGKVQLSQERYKIPIKKFSLKDRLTRNDSVTQKYPNDNNNKGVKSSTDQIHSQYQDPSIWTLLDSNRRYLRENRLSPDNTRSVKIVACSNLDDLEVLTDSIPDDLEILFLHVGVNDLEFHAAERVHKEYCSIISKIKDDFPNLKIVLSEITPRFDISDNQVLHLNALLLASFKNDKSAYIISNSNLRKESYFSDNKHIKKENINILASNIKHGLRRILGIRYSTGCSQHNTVFAKSNKNEVVQMCTNFFEYLRIRKLIRENKFVILNL